MFCINLFLIMVYMNHDRRTGAALSNIKKITEALSVGS